MNTKSNSNSGLLLLVKKEITDNRKAILLGIGALWICCILIGTLLGFNGRGGGESEIFLFALLFMAFGCIAASVTFSNMKCKESRISTLMLPASIFQKFLVRWIAVVPVLFIPMFIGYYIGDITRIFAYYLHSLSSDPIPFRGETYMSIQNPCGHCETHHILLFIRYHHRPFDFSLFLRSCSIPLRGNPVA